MLVVLSWKRKMFFTRVNIGAQKKLKIGVQVGRFKTFFPENPAVSTGPDWVFNMEVKNIWFCCIKIKTPAYGIMILHSIQSKPTAYGVLKTFGAHVGWEQLHRCHLVRLGKSFERWKIPCLNLDFEFHYNLLKITTMKFKSLFNTTQ